MKRSPLRRRSLMRRAKPIARAPVRRRRGSTKYARRERDTDRMGWIKRQPCSVGLMFGVEFWAGPTAPGPCRGHIEAHHAGVRGLSQKAGDETCIPLCSGHHRALTDRISPFSGWPRGAVKAWELAMVWHYQAEYERHLATKDSGLY